MDGQRFDELTRFLSASVNRKRFLAFLTGIAAPGVMAGGFEGVEARKSRHKSSHRRKRRNGGGVGAQGENGVCGSVCITVEDCTGCPNPVCSPTKGDSVCLSDCNVSCGEPSQCDDLPGNCICADEGCLCDEACAAVCSGDCTTSDDCADTCACLDGACAPFCPGNCDGDPSVCNEIPGGEDDCLCPNGACRCTDGVCLTCEGSCQKDAECDLNLPNCVCIIESDETIGACGAADLCPGLCQDSADCEEQGSDACVCFLGDEVNVAAAVGAEGVIPAGECGECLGVGLVCDASTECCGQLICQNGACARKRKPSRRCHKHGGSCQRDNDCCAQAVCYKGKCGEKDTHCHNDGECAQGYRCQGGPLAPGHRRCRKSGRHKRNKTQRKNG